MSIQEHVILVNDQGKVIGTQEKYAAHTSHTPLHLAFSSWLFNANGECLITRRALSKKAWPGVWTNSVCGHPQADEATEQAIIRRCRFEVGAEITDITPIAPEFRYREADPSGIIENEICPVYAARVTNTLAINDWSISGWSWTRYSARWTPHRGHLARGWCRKRTPRVKNSAPSRRNKKAPAINARGFFYVLKAYFTGRIAGNRITSRMVWLLVNSITIRSIPIPRPAVGGRPCSSAVT